MRIVFAVFFLTFFSCSSNEYAPQEVEGTKAESITDTAAWIISESIKAHGGDFKRIKLTFNFRDRSYAGLFNNGDFTMSRAFEKEGQQYLDVYTNTGFARQVEDRLIEVTPERANAYSNSINSVFYFAMLPQKLTDQAVIPTYLGETKIEGKDYHVLSVQFHKEGGGEDHKDSFMYWFNAETMLLEFMAYSYETDGGGIRFRKSLYQHKLVNGYIFQDYENYKPTTALELNELPAAYERGELEKISLIQLENIDLSSLPLE